MTDKAVISAYTYRSAESLRESAGDMPVFVLPDDLPQLFRQTIRKSRDCLHVESLGVLADTEEKLREFLALARKGKAKIASREDGNFWVIPSNIENLVKWWRDARRKGSAQIGASIGAKKKKAASEERAKGLTKQEWLNSAIKNAQLVEKYDVALGTLRRIASDKGWGWNRQQAIWRAEQRKAK